MKAKLLDFAKDSLHVAGIFSKQAALEHQRITDTGAVSYLPESCDALIGVDPQQRPTPVVMTHDGKAEVGDFQFRRP
jgi:hypothetical protein